jgi:radical SAM protein with 4Fe4S-binding SPASM domain
MFDIVASIKPDCLILYLSWFTNEELGRSHAELMKKELRINAETWKSYLGQNLKIDTDLVKKTLERLAKKKFPFGWLHIPGIPFKKVPAYYGEPADFLGYGPCIAPYLMVDILPNGDVVTCRDYIDVKVGNVLEHPLLELWNNDIFRKFRRLLRKNGGTLPQCSRCCGLMGF